jgi:hypothetical protein
MGSLTEPDEICYNDYMHKVIIDSPMQALNAGNWLNERGFKNSDWELDVNSPFTPQISYTFRFKNSKHAVEFALKWMQ